MHVPSLLWANMSWNLTLNKSVNDEYVIKEWIKRRPTETLRDKNIKHGQFNEGILHIHNNFHYRDSVRMKYLNLDLFLADYDNDHYHHDEHYH